MKTPTTSPSLKSVSSSKSPKYKRSKTLKRNPTFHELREEDKRYIWAAYKLGVFGQVEDPKQEEFNNRLNLYLAMNDVMYVFEADTQRGRIPVGVLTGKLMGPLMWLGDAIWFPWASDRNKYESMVNVMNELRRTYVAIFTCTLKDKHFYEKVARHGVIRRVGTLHDLAEEPLAQWQTRKPNER